LLPLVARTCLSAHASFVFPLMSMYS